MHSKKMIENIIRDAVKNVTGIIELKKDDSLIDKELKIIPADFIYIFDILRERLQLPVHDIFVKHTFEVMTIENMTDALFELKSEII